MVEGAIAIGESLLGSASKILGGFWGYALVAAIAASGAAYASYQVTAWAKDETIHSIQLADAKAAAAALQNEIARTRAEDAASASADMSLLTAWRDHDTVTHTITREITRYVTPQTDARFPLPCSFVRVHDAAALGVDVASVPNPPGKSDGDACEVTDSQALDVITENYGAARDALDQVAAWQDWYRALMAIAPQPSIKEK